MLHLSGFTPFPDDVAARYRELGYWQDRPLGEVFDEYFARGGEREAMVFGDRRTTYSQLNEQVNRLAQNLWGLGFRHQDVVVMQLPNCDTFVILYFALVRIGVIPLMALPAHREHEIAHYLAFTEAKGYAVADRTGKFDSLEFATRMADGAPNVQYLLVSGDAVDDPRAVSIERLIAQEPSNPIDLDVLGIDASLPAVFQLSGGTTGIPKIIPRTHNDYAFNVTEVGAWCGLGPDQTLLIAVPMAHNQPLATPGLMGTFSQGGRIVISPSPRPSDALPLIARERVTQTEGTPAMYVGWIEDPLAAALDLTSVQSLRSGGQRCQPELKHRIEKVFPNGRVTEGFGMGEGLIMWVQRDDPEEVRLNTVGRPWCPDDEIRVVDKDYNDVPDGVTGQLLVRGPYTLRGYYNVPETNAVSFTEDGFLCTGDLVTRRPDGYFTVDGRIKDLVNRGGEKISTEEVENLLLAQPDIKNCACVPVEDAQLGERMAACIELREGCEEVPTVESISAHLAAHGLARFKHPEYVFVFDELPLSPFGKVSKKALGALAAERAEA